MGKTFTFTTKDSPINDLLALDLQNHLEQMGRLGWDLISTQTFDGKHGSATQQMIFFWGKDE